MSGLRRDPYIAIGDKKKTEQEYQNFCGSIAQLLDDKTLVGDAENRWVIFKDGWVYGLATYPCESDARAFARQMFRDEPDASYIIVEVNLERHDISPLVILASAFSDVDAAKFKESNEEDEEDAQE